MTKGTFLYNNWLLAGAALAVLGLVALISALQGGLTVDLGGLQLVAEGRDGGGLRLLFVRAP